MPRPSSVMTPPYSDRTGPTPVSWTGENLGYDPSKQVKWRLVRDLMGLGPLPQQGGQKYMRASCADAR